MKTILLFLLLMPVCISGQNLIQAEYFFDEDPGYGQGIKMNFAPNPNISISANLYIGLVPPGYHTLYYRFKDDNSGWGQTYRRNVLVGDEISKLKEAEYFFDSDPGYGNGITLQFADEKEISLTANLYFDLIKPGFHTLFYRFNSEKGWGNTYSRNVYKPAISKITKIVYRFDDEQEEHLINIIPSVLDLNYAETIDIEALEDAMHKIYFQVENENGFRSNTWTSEFGTGPKAGTNAPSDLHAFFYPNPASDHIYFKSEIPIKNICIASMDGIVLKTIDSSNAISLNEIPDGTYLVSYQIQGMIKVTKLIIIR